MCFSHLGQDKISASFIATLSCKMCSSIYCFYMSPSWESWSWSLSVFGFLCHQLFICFSNTSFNNGSESSRASSPWGTNRNQHTHLSKVSTSRGFSSTAVRSAERFIQGISFVTRKTERLRTDPSTSKGKKY